MVVDYYRRGKVNRLTRYVQVVKDAVTSLSNCVVKPAAVAVPNRSCVEGVWVDIGIVSYKKEVRFRVLRIAVVCEAVDKSKAETCDMILVERQWR